MITGPGGPTVTTRARDHNTLDDEEFRWIMRLTPNLTRE